MRTKTNPQWRSVVISTALLGSIGGCLPTRGPVPVAESTPPAEVASCAPVVPATELPRVRAPRDRSALEKTDSAIDELYLKGKEAEAEAQLKGIYLACEDRCSGPVKARAWMYVGVIWGNARPDPARAREAFRYALQLDPSVALDEALAAPPTRRVFEEEQARVEGGW
ncbi:MAG: hypothetical protein JW751_05735 [Polyangiaceae bacterium]|nr:hypothetical protein [Polyangiaceae bacterium]